MADDGFHEIQLGKKQLVFAFMAAAVLVVVVFLFGVWVGRDVRRPDLEIAADPAIAEVAPDTQQPPTQVSPTDLDYNARVQSGTANTAQKPDAATKPIEPPTPAAESGPPEPAPKAAPDATKPAPDAKSASAAGGFYVQVAAFSTKKPADTLMARLKKKSYDAYVVTEPTGPSRFRVRVGPFANRAAAEESSARLKNEEGLTPLVRR